MFCKQTFYNFYILFFIDKKRISKNKMASNPNPTENSNLFDESAIDYVEVCEEWLKSVLFMLDHEGWAAEDILIHDNQQIQLAFLCFLYPKEKALTLIFTGDSGTRSCDCCDGYLIEYYDFLFVGEVLCSVEVTYDSEGDGTITIENSSKINELMLAKIGKEYKKQMHIELLAEAWHPDRAFEWVFDISSIFCKK